MMADSCTQSQPPSRVGGGDARRCVHGIGIEFSSIGAVFQKFFILYLVFVAVLVDAPRVHR